MAKETTENQNVKSKRDAFRERFSKRYPNINMDDEDAVYGQFSTDYDQFDQNNQRMDDFNNMLRDFPQAPGLITGMSTRKNPDGSEFSFTDYLIDNLGQDFIDAINGDDEARARLKKKEKDEVEASEKLAKSNEELAAAMDKEDAELEAFIKEAKIKPEDIKSMIEWMYGHEEGMEGFIWRAAKYQLTKDDFKRLMQIKDFDKAVADAEDKGYKRGRNEKIDQQKKLHDGTKGGKNVSVSGGGGPASLPREKSDTELAYERMRGM